MVRKFFFRGWLIWFAIFCLVIVVGSPLIPDFMKHFPIFFKIWFVGFLLFTIGCIGLYFGQPPVVRVVMDDRDR